MPISVFCPSCNKESQVNDELAGKRATCRACGQVVTIPVVSTSETNAAQLAPKQSIAPSAPLTPQSASLYLIGGIDGESSPSHQVSAAESDASVRSKGLLQMLLNIEIWEGVVALGLIAVSLGFSGLVPLVFLFVGTILCIDCLYVGNRTNRLLALFGLGIAAILWATHFLSISHVRRQLEDWFA